MPIKKQMLRRGPPVSMAQAPEYSRFHAANAQRAQDFSRAPGFGRL